MVRAPVIAATLLIAGWLPHAAAQEVDLYAGTLNGAPICEATLDDVIGVLGRPSAVKPATEVLSIAFGPELFWHARGVNVLFEPGDVGRELVRTFTVHLSRVWDGERSEWYQVFDGILTPAATADWRVQDSLAALEALNPIEMTLEDALEELRALGVEERFMPTSYPHNVEAELSTESSVILQHEPVTRFLERVIFRCFAG